MYLEVSKHAKMMYSNSATFTLAIIILLAKEVRGYPTGADAMACANFDPSLGHGPSTATGADPYQLTFSTDSYTAGRNVTVTLSSSGGDQFKGFLVSARRADGVLASEPVGTMSVDGSTPVKTMCPGTTGTGAVTHTDSSVKSSVTFTWTAPDVSVGDVEFHYSVVRGGAPSIASNPSDYFLNDKSSVVKGPPVPTGKFTKDPTCGIQKGCYSNCQSDNTCDWEMSWKESGTFYEMRLRSFFSADNKYISLGFSNVSFMAPASVVSCLTFQGAPHVVMSFNPTTDNEPLTNPLEGITNVATSFNDGILDCTFRRDTSSSTNPKIFDLADPWYLIAARGDAASATTLKYHVERYKAEQIMANNTSTDLTFPMLTTTVAPLTSTTTGTPGQRFPQDSDCGVAKGCYSDCQDNLCGFLASWSKVGDLYKITIKSIYTGANSNYASFGFATAAKMYPASTTECLLLNDEVQFRTTYNSAHSPPTVLDPPTKGLSDIKTSNVGGMITCEAMRVNSSDDFMIFDLSQKYHLIAAWGKAFPDGSIGIHDPGDRFVSSGTYLPQDTSVDVSLEIEEYPKIKAHGCLMVFAWMFAASIGLAMARFFKKLWPENRICGLHVWFSIHRACMVTVFVVGMAGFAIIFIQVEGYSDIVGEDYMKSHPILGIITTGLLFINPFMSLLRCKPDDPRRIYFNVAHQAVGVSAHILAAVTITFGLYLPKAQMDEDTGLIVMIVYGAWHVTFFLIMTILDQLSKSEKSKRVSDGNATELTSVTRKSQGSYVLGTPGESQTALAINTTNREPPKSLAKKFMLGIHTTVLLALSTVLFYLIIDGDN